MDNPDKPSEPDWDAYRARVRDHWRRRATAGAFVIIFLGAVFVAAVRILAPQDYPPGDIRNELVFRLAFGAISVVLIGALMLGALQRLRDDE